MIYIGTFAKTITDADLIAFFAANESEVTNVHVMMDSHTGRSRRFGLATAQNPAAVVAACNGKLLDGQPMTVKPI